MKASNPAKIFKAVELASDHLFIEDHLAPEEFDTSDLSTKSVPLFKKYGIKVPLSYSQIYSMYNGIADDRYISNGLYYYYITPYLMNLNLVPAYDDKNIYGMLFPNIKQPQVLLRNMNNRFYVPSCNTEIGAEVSIEIAAESLLKHEAFIIKPALISGNGSGVCLFKTTNKEVKDVIKLLTEYGANFIVQSIVKNHSELSRLNPTSLNTCRIISYRCVKTGDYVILASMVRFGGEGDIKDNATNGGGFCKINPDGAVDDKIYSYRHFTPKSLNKDKGISSAFVPNYQKMKALCIESHKLLPYFDLIGWDFTVDDQGDIVLIEYNWAPTIGGIQISNGPLFGDYTEDLISKLSAPITTEVNALRRRFEGGASWNEYIFDLDKKIGL